ncbi:uncharacterized protein ACA1_228670 [Acanthamoeba castellanii str. Neff]|uniref:Transmembrane protein n=1 Tax=Acanthamoeba castellanii (strain ATCC 30010 / Neff) TaxID=1257118 RepID=L8HB53_ACACF|nr:uncharacterized protein ACA1_228670 [Acanthamoeba castellanii str. Neff]ELR21596.1 hypothetical protein ACA1_228670 [Acanthamoeba castellanii str. Neff]
MEQPDIKSGEGANDVVSSVLSESLYRGLTASVDPYFGFLASLGAVGWAAVRTGAWRTVQTGGPWAWAWAGSAWLGAVGATWALTRTVRGIEEAQKLDYFLQSGALVPTAALRDFIDAMRPRPLWNVAVWTSFVASVGSLAVWTYRLPAGCTERSLVGVSAAFLVFATAHLARFAADQSDAEQWTLFRLPSRRAGSSTAGDN